MRVQSSDVPARFVVIEIFRKIYAPRKEIENAFALSLASLVWNKYNFAA